MGVGWGPARAMLIGGLVIARYGWRALFFILSMAGVIAPAATGLIVQETGSFYLPFVSCCAVLVMGALGYAFVVGRVVPVFTGAEPEPAST